MFTGIVEALGTVREIIMTGSARVFWIESPFTSELTVDQSLSHDGACMTVEEIRGNQYRFTAVKETLRKTNLGQWQPGYLVNLERSLRVNDRLDGHLVQGHIDCRGVCEKQRTKDENREFTFSFPAKFSNYIIEKGSICVNGVSLTAFNVKKNRFTVTVIPYTFEHTNFQYLRKDDRVNIEFDLIGKYIEKLAVVR